MTSILIVDDNASYRAQARALLEADGFLVVGEAGDGAAGVAAARSLMPDLVLLDIGLPDTDGFMVAAELAREQPATPVILISSRDASAYGPRLASSPTLGFIAKDDLSRSAILALTVRR